MNAWQKRAAVFARWAGGPVFPRSARRTQRADSITPVAVSDGPSQARCSQRRSGTIWRAAMCHKKLVGSPYSSSRRIAACIRERSASLRSKRRLHQPRAELRQKMDGPEGPAHEFGLELLPAGRIRIGLNDVAGVLALRDFSSFTVCVHRSDLLESTACWVLHI